MTDVSRLPFNSRPHTDIIFSMSTMDNTFEIVFCSKRQRFGKSQNRIRDIHIRISKIQKHDLVVQRHSTMFNHRSIHHKNSQPSQITPSRHRCRLRNWWFFLQFFPTTLQSKIRYNVFRSILGVFLNRK